MSWAKAQVKVLKWSKSSVEMLMREADPQLVRVEVNALWGGGT
jgi:hypothetical protein